jgi:hypothetical protein
MSGLSVGIGRQLVYRDGPVRTVLVDLVESDIPLAAYFEPRIHGYCSLVTVTYARVTLLRQISATSSMQIVDEPKKWAETGPPCVAGVVSRPSTMAHQHAMDSGFRLGLVSCVCDLHFRTSKRS